MPLAYQLLHDKSYENAQSHYYTLSIWTRALDVPHADHGSALLWPSLIALLWKTGVVGSGKVYPNLDQTFQAEFNELVFISIAESEFRGFSTYVSPRFTSSPIIAVSTDPTVVGAQGMGVWNGSHCCGDFTGNGVYEYCCTDPYLYCIVDACVERSS